MSSAAAPHAPSTPRASATLVVVRDGSDGIEVLLSHRAERGDHNSGAWVFPGGLVDAMDAAAHALCVGLDDAAASARLGLESGGLDYYIAAVRECFEESGLLYGCDPRGELVTLDVESRLAAWRVALYRNECALGDLCSASGLRLAVDRLIYLSHWLTPIGRPKRYDTRFFIAAAPPMQIGAHDGTEMVEQRWLRPAEALRAEPVLKLLTPTQKTLELIERFDTVASLLAWAAAPRERALIMPRAGIGRDGPRPVLPDEHAWAELGRIDPQGHGHGSYEIEPDRPVRLSSRVIRVSANNGSVMTGPGTNTYLVGNGARNEWAVIDPGPLLAEHVDAVVAAAPGPIRWILATHTHHDHSPATVPLRERTGAQVYGMRPAHAEWQDMAFAPDTVLQDGERLALSETTTLRVLHTPGHASNHLCYLLEEEQTLFTGDHVMQASTVVINPPDGDMAAYLASLRALLAEDLEWLAPGHGFLMAEPRRAIEAIIEHRLRREAKVLEALTALAPAPLETLLPRVYADVPSRLHPVALRSLRAHLLKLRDDGVALETAGIWSVG